MQRIQRPLKWEFPVLSLLMVGVTLLADRPLIAKARISMASVSTQTQAAVRLEAADAYLTGGVRVDTNHSGYSGGAYIDNYVKVGATAIFTVNVPSNGAYPVTLDYANGTGVMKTLSIYA